MNRTEVACWALIAAAFTMAGLLVVQLGDTWVRPAHAELVISGDSFSLMTAQTRSDEESLFVLDGYNERLLIYRLDLGRKRMELSATADLTRIFSAGGVDDNDGHRGGRVSR